MHIFYQYIYIFLNILLSVQQNKETKGLEQHEVEEVMTNIIFG